MFDREKAAESFEETGIEESLGVPAGHSDDPFACPCCANVFAELLRETGGDLERHGRALESSPPTVTPPRLISASRVVTMNAEQPEAESLLVRDGRIAWVGRLEDAPKSLPEDTERIDLGDRVVVPGFVEPHMHLAPLAMLHAFENVGPLRLPTTEAVLKRLREIAAETPAGEWIVARQFDPSLQEGPAALTADLLDEASTEHPIFVYNASLHIAYANHRALELAGVDTDTVAPPGSELGREASGRPNGVLKGGPAMALVGRVNPKLRAGNLAEACLGVFRDANAVGITTLCDQGTGMFQGARELELYRSLRESNRMTARFRYSLSDVRAAAWDEAGLEWGRGDEWVRVTGWKIVSDGSNQGRTGLQREPFLESEDCGIAYVEESVLHETVERRLREGWAVCVHANGDAAIDRTLDAFERAKEQGLDPAARRCRIEHCSILHDDQIERMSELGISPSFLIGHVYYWGSAFVNDIFGLEKASKLDRTGACEARGIRWTIHSDDPVTEMNPLRCMHNAVTRTMWKSDGVLAPDERISAASALRAVTIDAAWQCHSDHEVGSLDVGKLADFVVLRDDPRSVPAEQLGAMGVQETWVGGRRVYAAGEGG